MYQLDIVDYLSQIDAPCDRPVSSVAELVSTATLSVPLLTNSSSPTAAPAAPGVAPIKERSGSARSNPDLCGQSHGVYQVSVNGRRYFRYIVNRGHKIEYSLHIAGGSISNPIAQARAKEIQDMIDAGSPVAVVYLTVRSWSKRR